MSMTVAHDAALAPESQSSGVPAALNLAPLVAPIRPDAPAGESLYYDRTYDLLRDARREDDASLPRGIWQRELKRANWLDVQELATTALATRSKDLQIAAWLLEAWTHLHGFVGAGQGFCLIRELCDRYWDDMFPLPDGGDLSGRTLVIDWTNEHLWLVLQAIPLTQPTSADARVWNWSERHEALRAENLVLRGTASPPPKDADVLTSAKMFASIVATPRAFYVDLDRRLRTVISAVRAVEETFDARCGDAAPSLSKVLEVLKAMHEWAETVLIQRGSQESAALPPTPVALDAAPEPLSEEHMEGSRPATAGPVMMADHARARAEAYGKLAEAAHTLMRIEPHSPTPYLVFRAIAWGEMSLAELMRHFMSSNYDIKSLYSMLGMDDWKSPNERPK
jgi:type VI secretion system protein ImpA